MAEYYGAELWRACVLVVALLNAAAPTSVSARGFDAADTQNQDYPTAQARGDQALGDQALNDIRGRSTEHLQKVLDGPIGRKMLAGSERRGLVGLVICDAGAHSICSSIRPGDKRIFHEAATASTQFMHQKWRDLAQRSRGEAEETGVTIIRDFDRKPFQAAMAPIHEKAERDPAIAALIDRMRRTE